MDRQSKLALYVGALATRLSAPTTELCFLGELFLCFIFTKNRLKEKNVSVHQVIINHQ